MKLFRISSMSFAGSALACWGRGQADQSPTATTTSPAVTTTCIRVIIDSTKCQINNQSNLMNSAETDFNDACKDDPLRSMTIHNYTWYDISYYCESYIIYFNNVSSVYYGDEPVIFIGTLTESFSSNPLCVDEVPNGKFKLVHGGSDYVSNFLWKSFCSSLFKISWEYLYRFL